MAGRAVRRGRRRHAPAGGAELHPGGVPVNEPKLSWSDLAGARVGIWGLGREGHANLRKLMALGVEPVLVDDRPPAAVDGPPVLSRPVLATGDGDYWVIEVSSYQATDLPCSPPVVAVTSLHPDHLDWHGGVEQYYRDKLSACSQPGAELTVANGDSDLLRERAGLLGPRVEWVREDEEPGADWMEPLGLPGRHNRRNALIARRCLAALGVPGVGDDAGLRAAAAGYRPLPSRLTPVGTVDGVTFVDDSLSTNVLPTLAALDAFPGRRIALIVGGQDRGIDYAPLAAAVLAHPAPTFVLTLPDNGPRIRAQLEAAQLEAAQLEAAQLEAAQLEAAQLEAAQLEAAGFAGVTDCRDLDAAVAAGFGWARPEGVVLLSPAAPSFGRYRDYRDRGEAFARAVRALS